MAGKTSWNQGPIIRAEQSANLDGNESNKIFEIEYVFGADDDASTGLVDGTGRPPNTGNLEVLQTGKPVIIKEYKVQVASNDLVMIHQYYGDSDQTALWNTTEATFHRGLKQYKLVPGSKVSKNSSGTEHRNNYAARTIHFDTDYIKRRGKKGYWKNGLRPIVLSKNRGKKFGFTVSNLSGNENAWFWAIVEIKRWSILD